MLLVGPDGGHVLDAPVHLGDNVWRVGFRPLTVEGDYAYSVGPDVLDQAGRPMDQDRDGGTGDPISDVYRAGFSVDFSSLVVDFHVPVGRQDTFIDYVDVAFSEAIEGSTFTAGDVVLSGPAGAIAVLDPVQHLDNTWRIPFVQQQSEGDYTIVVGPDIEDLAGHSMSDAYTVTFEIRLADLAASGLVVPAVGGSGNDLDIGWHVANEAAVTADDPWVDQLYLSDDDVPGDDTQLGYFAAPPDVLAPGDHYDRTRSLDIPDVAPGDYYVIVQADRTDLLAESDETDNVAVTGTIRVNSLDLTMTEPVLPTDNRSGEATGGWIDRVYLQDAADPAADPVELGEFVHETPLSSGRSYTRQETVRVPRHITGAYYVVVTADRKNELFEHAAEENNATVDETPLLITVKPRPDLQITSIAAPATVDPEGSLSAEFVIVNQGSVATTRAHWVDRVYLSLDDKVTSDDLLIDTMANQSALASSESYLSISAAGVVPRHFRGDMFVLVQIDAYYQMDEWPNEQNNVLAAAIHVNELPLADLVVSDVVVPTQAIAGSEIDVRFTVTNLGPGETDRDWWTEQLWLCADKDLPTPKSCDWNAKLDKLLTSFEHYGTLDAGQGYDVVMTVKLPEDLESGQYYITPWADPYQFVAEDTLAIYVNPDDPHQIDNNNYKAWAIDVIGLPQDVPDLVVESVVVDAEASGGEELTVTYTVRNRGTAEAAI